MNICQVTGCKSPAKFGLNRVNLNGSKQWLWVCGKHDREIGNENLYRAGFKERE